MGAGVNQVCALAVQVVQFMRAREPSGDMVDVWLTRDEKSPSRRRGEPKYLMEIGFSWAPGLGRVLVVDGRGYGRKLAYRAAAEWIGKNLNGRAVHLQINVQDASSVPPAWTKKRLDSLEKSLQEMNLPALVQAAQDKRATVAPWVDSQRKTDVLEAATVVEWCAYFARATAPGGSMGADRQDGPAGGVPGGVVAPPAPAPAPAPGNGAGLPSGWAWREDVGVYVWANGEPDGSMAQVRAFSWVRPALPFVRENGAPDDAHFSGAGFSASQAAKVNERYVECVALLYPKGDAAAVPVMVQGNGPYGARLGYLLASMSVRNGDAMQFELEAEGQFKGQISFTGGVQEMEDGMMAYGLAQFDF